MYGTLKIFTRGDKLPVQIANNRIRKAGNAAFHGQALCQSFYNRDQQNKILN